MSATFWFFVTLSLESSVIPLADTINEYRIYLPSVGIALSVVFLLLAIGEKLRTVGVAVGILDIAAVALGVATHLTTSPSPIL